MLDEKKTAAALKEAWRRGGYRFVLTNGILSVRTDVWGFQAALVNVPPKVLGLITEHLGSIMEDGFAFLLKKDSAEQSVMLDQEAIIWLRIRGTLDHAATPCKMTPLSYNGLEVWQEQGHLGCAVFDPGDTRIVEDQQRQDARCDGSPSLLLWSSMAGTIAFARGEIDPDAAWLDRVSGYPWCGEGS